MTIQQQNQAFNNSIAIVEQANRELIQLYENAIENVNRRVAVLKLQFEKGLLDQANRDRLRRLERFISQMREDITILKVEEYNIVTSGFVSATENSYYGTGYSIENDLNRTVLNGQNFDHTVGYRRLNSAYIRQIYTRDIATQVYGLGIKDRIESDILQLQAKIKQAVTQSLIEGQSPTELARRLRIIDTVFEQNRNHAFTVARTEILRGHSYGQLESINQAQEAGIDGLKVWSSTLDGFTRKDHRIMDGQVADEDTGLFTLPDGTKSQVPRGEGLSAKQTVNCRCSTDYRPTGFTPNSRGSRLANGEWVQVNGDMTYMEWAQTLDGRLSIEASESAQRARARLLAKARREGRRSPLIENTKKRLEIEASARSIREAAAS